MGANNSIQIVWNWLWRNALTQLFLFCRSILYIDSEWVLQNKVYILYTL